VSEPEATPEGDRGIQKWLPWIALAVVVAVAVALGARGEGGHESVNHRVERIARGVRCPTCRDLSAAESDAAAAKAVRVAIRREVVAGKSDGEIRASLADRYGRDILLTPSAGGVVGLVWVLPVVAVIAGLGFLAVAFRRWRPGNRVPTAEERAAVEEALRG
jgi:cytochrome c-type biogenesis protein CcmH